MRWVLCFLFHFLAYELLVFGSDRVFFWCKRCRKVRAILG